MRSWRSWRRSSGSGTEREVFLQERDPFVFENRLDRFSSAQEVFDSLLIMIHDARCDRLPNPICRSPCALPFPLPSGMDTESQLPPNPEIPAGAEAITLEPVFWCIEAAYNQLEGVHSAVSGAWGATENPTYADICTGQTGHAEVVRVVRSGENQLGEGVGVVLDLHDPTELNRQGNDGPTTGSAISTRTKRSARPPKHQKPPPRQISPNPSSPILSLKISTPADKYHQDYYFQNPGAGYCRFVIEPKLKKLGLKH